MALFPLGILSAAGVSGAVASDYELISTQVLGSAISTVSFDVSTFASTYKHLQLRILARSTRTGASDDYLELQFNNVTSTSYAAHSLLGYAGSVSSSARAGFSSMRLGNASVPTAAATANSYGAFVVDILDPFSTTKNTTARTLAGRADDLPLVHLQSGAFFNTAAITEIDIFNTFANHAVGSRFSLYGIKG
jgi:hypothetical protein